MDKEILLKELQFKAVRSSGPGGQHANKVSSKVVLIFDLRKSNGLSESEKQLISIKLKSRLSSDSLLMLHCDDSRSQHKNKDIVIQRFFSVLKNAIQKPKKRKATKPTKTAIEKRLSAKKKNALIKANRGKPKWE